MAVSMGMRPNSPKKKLIQNVSLVGQQGGDGGLVQGSAVRADRLEGARQDRGPARDRPRGARRRRGPRSVAPLPERPGEHRHRKSEWRNGHEKKEDDRR